MNTDNLPKWATYDKEQDIIIVDPDVVYPLYFKKLGYDRRLITQAYLEVARLCFTEDLFKLTGKGLKLRILKKYQEVNPDERQISTDPITGEEMDQGPLKTPDDTWRLDNYLPGKPMSWMDEYRRMSST